MKKDLMLSLFWIGVSLFAMIGSYELDLGNFRNPGPGLMPFFAGAALFLLSIPLAVKSFRTLQKRKQVEEIPPSNLISFGKVVLVALLMVVHVVLLDSLGYVIDTLLFLVFLFWISGCRKWKVVLIASIGTLVGSYVLFSLFGVNFPKGMFNI